MFSYKNILLFSGVFFIRALDYDISEADMEDLKKVSHGDLGTYNDCVDLIMFGDKVGVKKISQLYSILEQNFGNSFESIKSDSVVRFCVFKDMNEKDFVELVRKKNGLDGSAKVAPRMIVNFLQESEKKEMPLNLMQKKLQCDGLKKAQFVAIGNDLIVVYDVENTSCSTAREFIKSAM